ncbi:FAKD5 protein, partial [Polypterus senegalus]
MTVALERLCGRFHHVSMRMIATTPRRAGRDKKINNFSSRKVYHDDTKNNDKVNGLCKNENIDFLEYTVFFNPSAYYMPKKRDPPVQSHENECDIEDTSARFSFNPGLKQLQQQSHTKNTYTVSCSRSLSSVKSNFVDESYDMPDKNKVYKCEHNGKDDEINTYDSKEDPRAFQKLREEYKSLCYSRIKTCSISVQEGFLILQKVAMMKGNLDTRMIAEMFEKLSLVSSEQLVLIKSDTRFAMLCRYAVENIRLFTSLQLINILQAFLDVSFPPTHSMLNVFDTELCKRVWDLCTDEILLVADLWRYLGRPVQQYLDLVYCRVGLHWRELNLPQLVQLVYIIGESRRAPQPLMQNLEIIILKFINELNPEELGSLCLGFFKSKCGLSDQTMHKIADRAQTEIKKMSSYAIVNVMKMLRFSRMDHLGFLRSVGEVVPERASTLAVQGMMHIVLSCASLHYLDERIFESIAAEIPFKAAYCRSKDAAKLLWSFSSLCYQPSNAEVFFSTLTQSMRDKVSEFNKYPEHLLTGLLALAFSGHFPIDLISIALSPDFVKLASEASHMELKKDLFTIDGTVEVEVPEYSGPRLSWNLCSQVQEMLRESVSKDICHKPEILQAESLIQIMLGGPQYVKNHMILPHMRSSDLEIHFDASGSALAFNVTPSTSSCHEIDQRKNNKVLKMFGVHLTENLMSQLVGAKDCKINDSMVAAVEHGLKRVNCDSSENAMAASVEKKKHLQESILTDGLLESLLGSHNSKSALLSPSVQSDASNSGIKKLTVQVTNRNHFCYNSRNLLGFHTMKRRQLIRTGYTVVELPFWEWFPLLKRTRSEKLAYLHSKIYGALE